MPTWFTLFSRKDPPCKYCIQAKELLDLHGIDYKEVDIEDPGVRQMFSEKGLRTVPQIFIEDRHLGGFTALEEFIKHAEKEKLIEYRTRGNRKRDEFHGA